MSKPKARTAQPSEVRETRPEYRFDYTRARPNRFASRFSDSTVTVALDPDVAQVFTSSKAVNDLLRSVIAAFPAEARRTAGSRIRRKAG